ncbi:hypothetical protein ABZ848_15305 [Streptomyces sp. NPDC047081]|uniref:hypothetical protein n=1 Tax=Streptomyces sp. NPDC047081 TaxID=3154706 RepID=UPI0033D0CE07
MRLVPRNRGVRNPARIFVDKKTDVLYAGRVGPDASAPSTTWGPANDCDLRFKDL